jgi:hypothetical protein
MMGVSGDGQIMRLRRNGKAGEHAEFSKTLISREHAEMRVKRLNAAFDHLVDDVSARGEGISV